MNRLLLLLSFVFTMTANAQKVTVCGRISNLNSVNDTDFILYFKQGEKVVDSTISRKAGYYSAKLNPGNYDIVVYKQSYLPQYINGLTFTSVRNDINLTLKLAKAPVFREPYLTTLPTDHSKSDTMYLDGVRVTGIRSVKYSSSSYSSSSMSKSKSKKHRRKKGKRKRSKTYSYKTDSRKKTGMRGASSTPSYAAGTTTTRSGIVGRGSRTDGYLEVTSTEKSSADIDPNPNRPGQVTAGHWRDIDHWKEWLKTNNDKTVASHMKVWGLYPKTLNAIKIANHNNEILPFVKIKLIHGSVVVWETVTDIEGKAYLWPMVEKDSTFEVAKDLELQYAGNTYTILDYMITYPDNTIKIQANKLPSQKIEIGFMVDATGSMGDEIKFLQRELIDVVSRIKKERPCMDIYTGSIFYKDHGDDYLTRVQPLTSNPVNTIDFISNQYASGGGDFPEAVDYGLEAAIKELNWSAEAGTKILFILLDAPPHENPEIRARLNNAIKLAATKGIRLVPVAASGINQTTEFLLKYMAILSNGEYLYITDDSHIGGRHLLPTGGKSDVEFLNDLMVNVILKYSESNCKQEEPILKNDTLITQDSLKIREQVKQKEQNEIILGSNWHMRFYPNPAAHVLYVDFSENIQSLSIYSMNGQLMYENKTIADKHIQVDVSDYNSGLYTVQVYRNGEMVSGKLVVIH